MEQKPKEKENSYGKVSIGFRLFQIGGYVLFFTAVFSFAYLTHTEIQLILGLIPFFALRYTFSKTYHADTTTKCLTYSITTFLVFCIFCLPLNISIYLNVLLGFLITYIFYLIKDYQDLKELKQHRINTKIYKGIKEAELLEIINPIGLEDLLRDILVLFYVKKINLTEIANRIGYTYQYTYELKSKALKKISAYYNKDT